MTLERLSERDLGVFCNNRDREWRAMQSAGTKMAFHLHFSSLYHIHTCPRWQRLTSSNKQDLKRDIILTVLICRY